jgi:hypothetical protein
MPRIEHRTITDQIFEATAPVQPDDCRKVNLEILVKALATSGPVVHAGHVVSVKPDGSIDFDGSKPFTPAPPTTHTAEDGTVTEIPAPEPTDEDYAKQWGLPVASSLPLVPKTPTAPDAPNTTQQKEA